MSIPAAYSKAYCLKQAQQRSFARFLVASKILVENCSNQKQIRSRKQTWVKRPWSNSSVNSWVFPHHFGISGDQIPRCFKEVSIVSAMNCWTFKCFQIGSHRFGWGCCGGWCSPSFDGIAPWQCRASLGPFGYRWTWDVICCLPPGESLEATFTLRVFELFGTLLFNWWLI